MATHRLTVSCTINLKLNEFLRTDTLTSGSVARDNRPGNPEMETRRFPVNCTISLKPNAFRPAVAGKSRARGLWASLASQGAS